MRNILLLKAHYEIEDGLRTPEGWGSRLQPGKMESWSLVGEHFNHLSENLQAHLQLISVPTWGIAFDSTSLYFYQYHLSPNSHVHLALGSNNIPKQAFHTFDFAHLQSILCSATRMIFLKCQLA